MEKLKTVPEAKTHFNRLNVDVVPGFQSIMPADWEALFPGLPDSCELMQLTAQCGFLGFKLQSIIVREEGRPILLLPVFETQYNFSPLMSPQLASFIQLLPGFLKRFVTVRLLCIGFPEGEWTQIGIREDAGPAQLEAAWRMALTAFDLLAKDCQADVKAVMNLASWNNVPIHACFSDYSSIAGFPCSVLPIPFNSMDEYMKHLSPASRKSLRRKIKLEKAITITRTTEPEPWLDTLYKFYRETVSDKELQFAVHTREFFQRVCQTVPGAEYRLYFLNDRLVAFNLVVVQPDRLIDKYFGMEPVLGREYGLYFLSWVENIRGCIQHKIGLYHIGPSSETLKRRLKAQFIPTHILFKHRNPVIQRVLNFLRRFQNYQSAEELPRFDLENWVRHRGKIHSQENQTATLAAFSAPVP